MEAVELNKILSGILIGIVLGIIILLVAGVDLASLSTADRADLRLISQPYLEATNLKDSCLASGAAWHEDKDFVGCVGMGPNSCTSDIVLSGQTQCIGAGANWACETGVQGFVYCRY